MNEWDAPDNTKTKKKNISQNVCVDCGIVSHCVSSGSMGEHGREGECVCNHCWSMISGNNECPQDGSCRGCYYYDYSQDD